MIYEAFFHYRPSRITSGIILLFILGLCWTSANAKDVSFSSVTSNQPAPRGQVPSEGEIKKIGEQLHASLQDRFNELVTTHNLPSANSERRDVSDIIAKYIPAGMPFLDAEKILRAADAHLADTPPRPARLNDPDYDRFDILGGIPLFQRPGVTAQIAIEVRPMEPANAKTTVKQAIGSFVIDAL